MNVELRWVDRNVPYMNFMSNMIRVLQYRQIIVVDDISRGRYQEWSEWTDVPLVNEKTESKI